MSLKASEGRIVLMVDMQKKNSHQFADGTKIHLARGYNNFNRREINPCNGIVIAAKDIPIGTEILFQYNAIQETFRVNNYKPLSGQETTGDIQYYSIPSEMAYAYLDESWGNQKISKEKYYDQTGHIAGEWKPIKPYAFGLRVFRPYSGILQGIEPTLLKDTLYVYTGELSGKIVKTLKACDYCIVHQGIDGREGNIIVFKHYEDEDSDREEVLCILDELTEQLHEGKLLVGLEKGDAKTMKEYDSTRTPKNTKRIAQ